MAKKVNTIVVGQGLAGSLLAWNLMRRGERVLVIDKQREDSASMVAAGIINPVTGPRLVQSWRLEELLSAARSTYRSLEKELKDRFYTEIELVRLFRSEEERRVWMSKKSQSGTNRYLGSMRSAGWKPALVDDPYGSFCPGGSGHLAVPKLLNGMRKFLLAEGSILDSHFTYSDLKPSSDGVQWGDWEAERIVFCEGHQASENPFFRNLPFKSSKGEILEVEAEEGSLPRAIINRGEMDPSARRRPLPRRFHFFLESARHQANREREIRDSQCLGRIHQSASRSTRPSCRYSTYHERSPPGDGCSFDVSADLNLQRSRLQRSAQRPPLRGPLRFLLNEDGKTPIPMSISGVFCR